MFYDRPIVFDKVEKQYLLTCKVTRCCLLALHGSITNNSSALKGGFENPKGTAYLKSKHGVVEFWLARQICPQYLLYCRGGGFHSVHWAISFTVHSSAICFSKNIYKIIVILMLTFAHSILMC